MSLIWERAGDAYYATVRGPDAEPLFRLIVEQLPEGMWDWIVWQSGGKPEMAVRSVARTVQEAMRAAEEVVAETEGMPRRSHTPR